MTEILREALVPHPPEKMFNLVADIASYPQYLPGCPKVHIHHQSDTETDATLFVQKGWAKFSFRTLNTNHKPHSIDMRLIEGPFQNLNGKWEFLPLGEKGEASKIRFTLSYAFSNRALNMTLNPAMEKLADTFLEAFCKQASLS